NAAAAKVMFKGNSVHPGTAKNKMINAGKMASEFVSKFPAFEAPEHTENYEGFYHLISITGDVENAEVYYIIRDFNKENFEVRKKTVEKFIEEIQQKYGEESISIDISDQYYNMREKIEPVMEVVDIA